MLSMQVDLRHSYFVQRLKSPLAGTNTLSSGWELEGCNGDQLAMLVGLGGLQGLGSYIGRT